MKKLHLFHSAGKDRPRKRRFETASFDPEKQYPAIRCSICTGEKVAGFRNNDGSFTEVMLIRSPKDEQEFKELYGIDQLKTEY
ncbi:MAG: aspartate dehydrogenase [Ruminococcus sp.]|nr:aspartate dehydrogenase [Ruminococcus sp.]